MALSTACTTTTSNAEIKLKDLREKFNSTLPPTVTPIENSVFYLKINMDFNFPSYSLRELLFRTTANNLDERLWKKLFKFDVDTSCLRGKYLLFVKIGRN